MLSYGPCVNCLFTVHQYSVFLDTNNKQDLSLENPYIVISKVKRQINFHLVNNCFQLQKNFHWQLKQDVTYFKA